MDLERDVELYLKGQVSKAGGEYFKFTSPGRAGVPDRILMVNGRLVFVELKRPGGKLRAQQRVIIDRIRLQGQKVYVISSKPEAQLLMKYLERGLLPDDRHFPA